METVNSTVAGAGAAGSGINFASLDASAVFLLIVTLCGFLLPVLLIFPPVPPRRSDALLETHVKLGIIDPRESNLRDQHSPDAAAAGAGGNTGRIKSLHVYPVKSCRGIEVTRARVLPVGLEFDRLFMFAQLKSQFPAAVASAVGDPTQEQQQHRWEFITQRQFPLLATVTVEVWQPDLAKCRTKGGGGGKPGADSTRSFVVLRFPWQDAGPLGWLSWVAAKLARGLRADPEKELVLPLEYPTAEEIRERGYPVERVRIWKETVEALNMACELPPELRLYLGVSNELALFRVDPARLREVYRCAPRREQAGYQPVTGFQDAYPLHMLNLSSVQDFDSQVPKDKALEKLDVRRFRANLIVSGPEPYDEETWKTIRFKPSATQQLDPAEFAVACRTVRCKLPNVDPDTGIRHPVEPDKSLRKFREVDEGAPKMGCLGMQLCPLFAKTDRPEYLESVLEVGMSLEVLQRGSHLYIKQ
ncbi:hypothetical protein NKR23_g8223 [Pleurostoma richardsiae]|uniref:MOSC domain-containing protein n=1 Tax=Pleurostoma richardsiae TaxID=41990 RepID=A0AA38VLT5_9PEZI|nr:hypothetical protein NKR23_g8223 [Pleurostoma richardsiae]